MKSVGVCETQPITAEGLRTLVDHCQELEFLRATASLVDGAAMVRQDPPDILVVDKGFGAQAVLAWIAEIRDSRIPVSLVVWGNTVSEAEALRLLQNGVKGIIRKTAEPSSLLACLRAVASGSSWMEESLFRNHPQRDRYPRSELTPREQQVLELVEQGLKNKEIARELGIRPGTVKIHLKHIFEKTGVRGRYGLALSGMKDKGLLALPHV
jgi:two-component system nitrate/nitrite response regulator NarL